MLVDLTPEQWVKVMDGLDKLYGHPMLIRICAWCKKLQGLKPGGRGVTHGMCISCEKKQEELENENKS